MAVARPALSVAGCSQCRLLVLNLFTGSVLRSAPLVRPSLCYSRPQVVGALPIRRFSSLPKPNDPASDAEHGQNARVLEEEPESSKDEDEGEAAATELKLANVPWYLQVDPPTHIAPLEPPPLPEVPPDAPPLIGSLLEYASEEMGLDELTLLDLRQLDPPPALGPSLFMLFGTARSERHLTSAPAAWCGGCVPSTVSMLMPMACWARTSARQNCVAKRDVPSYSGLWALTMPTTAFAPGGYA